MGDKLEKMVRDFYQTHAMSFSTTRQSGWSGWKKVVEQLPKTKRLKVLDLGCGNGRFLNYLRDRVDSQIEYVGVDGSDELLQLAPKSLDRVVCRWEVCQLDADWESLVGEDRFDLVVVFGVMHHLVSMDKRRDLLERAAAKVSKKGLLAVSFWQFEVEDRDKLPEIDREMRKSLGEGDHVLGWQGGSGRRFCHSFSDEEVEELIARVDLPVRDCYVSDGHSGRSNRYVVFENQLE